jgi:hypothetical protein
MNRRVTEFNLVLGRDPNGDTIYERRFAWLTESTTPVEDRLVCGWLAKNGPEQDELVLAVSALEDASPLSPVALRWDAEAGCPVIETEATS